MYFLNVRHFVLSRIHLKGLAIDITFMFVCNIFPYVILNTLILSVNISKFLYELMWNLNTNNIYVSLCFGYMWTDRYNCFE